MRTKTPTSTAFFAGLMLFLIGSAAYGQVGSLVSIVDFQAQCNSGLGVGITFDGTNLWYSCYASGPGSNDLYKADPTTGNVIAGYNVAGGLGSLAYDKARNLIWAGPGGGNFSGSVIKIALDASGNPVLPYTPGFATPQAVADSCGASLDDGLAIDGTSDILYVSYDCSRKGYLYAAATGVFQSSIPMPGPDSCAYNSGLAIGGNLLYEGSDGCSHVYVVDKTTLAAQFDFSTVVAGDPNFRDESLTCDPKTFFPTLGKQVMWSKEAYSPMRAHAYEIPINSCGSGGQPPSGNACPLSQGFWKNHAGQWPVTSLTLGGRSYTEAQLVGFLGTPPHGNAALILADQLIATLLDIANGSDPGPVNAAIADANKELAVAGQLPAVTRTNIAAGQAMTATAAILDNYNNDNATPNCTGVVPSGPAAP